MKPVRDPIGPPGLVCAPVLLPSLTPFFSLDRYAVKADPHLGAVRTAGRAAEAEQRIHAADERRPIRYVEPNTAISRGHFEQAQIRHLIGAEFQVGPETILKVRVPLEVRKKALKLSGPVMYAIRH